MVPIDTAAISDSVQRESAGRYKQHFRHGPRYRLIEIERNTPLGWQQHWKRPSECRGTKGLQTMQLALRRAGMILICGAAAAIDYEQNVILQRKSPPR